MEYKFSEFVTEPTKEYFNGLVRDFVPKSQKSYALVVDEICVFCKKDFQEIQRDDYLKYLDALREAVLAKAYKPQTVNRRIAVLRSFSEYINDRTFGLHKIFVENYDKYHEESSVRISSIPTWRELDRVLGIAREYSDGFYALCVIVVKMGVSIDKVVGLRYCDIILGPDGEFAGLDFKGSHHKKSYSVPLPKDVATILSAYLSKRGELNPFSHLFLGERGNKPLSVRMAEIRLKTLQEKAECTKVFKFRDLKSRGLLALTSTECSMEELEEFSGLSRKALEKYKRVASMPCPADLTNIRYV